MWTQQNGWMILAILFIFLVSSTSAVQEPAPSALTSTVFGEISPGQTASVNVTDNRAAGVQEVSITTNTLVKNVWVAVKELDDRPDGVTDIADDVREVYRYVKIDADNLNASVINTSAVDFAVETQWIEENSINASTIRLYRYQQNWQALETQHVNTTDEFYIFTAQTPGFSYFAIAGDGPQPAENNTTAVEDTGLDEQTGLGMSEPSTSEYDRVKEQVLEKLPVVMAALAILTVLGALYWRKEVVRTALKIRELPQKRRLEKRRETALERLAADDREERMYDWHHVSQQLDIARQHIQNRDYDQAEKVLTDVEQFLR